jgi:hypothetical protein
MAGSTNWPPAWVSPSATSVGWWNERRARTYRTYGGRLDVDEIRRRYESGESLARIGEVMGVSGTSVGHAMIRAGIPRRPGPRPAGERRGPLRHLDVDEIRRRWEAGETVVEIARAIGASRGRVRLAMDRVGIDRRSRRPTSGPA